MSLRNCLRKSIKRNKKVSKWYNENTNLFRMCEIPQEARRVIPQSAYTQIWGAFMPKQLDNYFKLRLDKHAQWEIQQTAIAMKELIT